MEMQLNKVLWILSILFLLISCKGRRQEKLSNKKILTIEEKTSIVFFEKKYFEHFQLGIDESNKSDHPFFKYLNCDKEGYFTVHFVPKENSLRMFWIDEYFKKYKYEYDDVDNENKSINNELKNTLNKYNIFSYQLKKEFLERSGNCTEESINLKKDAVADICLYNQDNKSWNLIKSLKTNILPPYVQNDFFIKNFPIYFKPILTESRLNWIGNYEVKYSENKNKDWKEEQSITLTITKDSILFEAAGYQLFQQYLLNGKIEKNTMRLKYLSAIDNTTSAVLEKTTDFGSIVYDGKKYTWQCPYINLSFGDGKPKDYILEKK